MQKIKYRAVFKSSGWIFVVWGGIVALKGLYDALIGFPESEFVPLAKWSKYSGFEVVYGLACIVIGLAIFELSKRIPEYIERLEADPR
ncbi:MAG: hypothetical protein A2539_04030 [Elusimicrobia bacterium RIFOXYD2_FULL_34_15]|nr:MAG: hypothetical protein A2539_04030 [Elusimicrobia bacterium RIFOXYD2_FULL_34_15]